MVKEETVVTSSKTISFYNYRNLVLTETVLLLTQLKYNF